MAPLTLTVTMPPPAVPSTVFEAFFFQAEDGIRDWSVTGVQTCALPIFKGVFEINPPSQRKRPLISVGGKLGGRLQLAMMSSIERPCLLSNDTSSAVPMSTASTTTRVT